MSKSISVAAVCTFLRTTLPALALAGVMLLPPLAAQGAEKGKWSKSGASASAKASAGGAFVDTGASGKRKVTRTRKDMILEVEMLALKEALANKQDEENTTQFVDKAEKEQVEAQACDLLSRMAQTGHPFILGSGCDILHVAGGGETIRKKAEAFVRRRCDGAQPIR